MKSVLIFAALCLSLAASVTLAKPPQKVNFSGAWTISWNESATNINPIKLTHRGAASFTGTYISDDKTACPVTGKMISPTSVTLTIACLGWEATVDGSVINSKLISGNYKAYGTSTGTFTMSRK